jgi:ubiquinone biosynthesis protein UbiJ
MSEVRTKRQEIDSLKQQVTSLTLRLEKLEAARPAAAKKAKTKKTSK